MKYNRYLFKINPDIDDKISKILTGELKDSFEDVQLFNSLYKVQLSINNNHFRISVLSGVGDCINSFEKRIICCHYSTPYNIHRVYKVEINKEETFLIKVCRDEEFKDTIKSQMKRLDYMDKIKLSNNEEVLNFIQYADFNNDDAKLELYYFLLRNNEEIKEKDGFGDVVSLLSEKFDYYGIENEDQICITEVKAFNERYSIVENLEKFILFEFINWDEMNEDYIYGDFYDPLAENSTHESDVSYYIHEIFNNYILKDNSLIDDRFS